MTNSRKIIVLFIIALILPSLIGVVSAAAVKAAWEYDVDGVDNRFGVTFLGAGWEFAGNDQYLSSFRVKLTNQSDAAGYLRAIVGNSTNMTIPMEITNQVNLANTFLAPSGTYVWVNFTFAETTYLAVGTTYYIGWKSNGSVANDFTAQYDVQGTNVALYSVDGALWTTTNNGWVYEIWTDGTGAAPPLDTSGWTDSDTSDLVEDFTNFFVPVFVLLLPALLLIFLTRRTDKWLLLIGLAIGAGLGYYFGLVPPWLLFLVAIGLIGLAYSEVKRNG